MDAEETRKARARREKKASHDGGDYVAYPRER